MHVSLLSWQNQLLAKGLLFVEEKVKLCEGKYSKKPAFGREFCFDVWSDKMICMSGKRTALLVLCSGVTQPLGSRVALQPLGGLRAMGLLE